MNDDPDAPNGWVESSPEPEKKKDAWDIVPNIAAAMVFLGFAFFVMAVVIALGIRVWNAIL